jgi:hypothetical protein
MTCPAWLAQTTGSSTTPTFSGMSDSPAGAPHLTQMASLPESASAASFSID